MIQSRRKFISTIVAGRVALPLFSDIKSIIPSTGKTNFPVRLFSKPLDKYDFNFICDCVSGAGIGMIDWDMYFRLVKELNIIAPITLHIEYPLLENGEENLPLLRKHEIITGKLIKDVDFINSYLKKYDLA
jgi:hypothetical protein